MDMIHLNSAFRDGRTDVGLVVVPSDRLSKYLTDRGPCMSDAKKHARAARLEDSSLVLFAIEHDGPGAALQKQAKLSGHLAAANDAAGYQLAEFIINRSTAVQRSGYRDRGSANAIT